MKVLKTIDAILVKIQEYAILFFVSIMVLLIIWQVIARYFLYISAPYAEEFARLAIVWCVFLGSALAVRNNEHMLVDVFIGRCSPAIQFAAKVFIYICMIILAVVMVIWGIAFYQATADDFATSLGYARNVFYLPTPVAGGLILLYSIVNCIKLFIDYFNPEGPNLNRGEVAA